MGTKPEETESGGADKKVQCSSETSANASSLDVVAAASEPPAKPFNRSKGFWAIMATLSVIGLLSALENTVVTTALPFIATQLDLGDNYIWVTNAFFLSGAAVQPLFGQLANIFGRRWITFSIVVLFTLGSGICGGANSSAMLIAGRTVQGMGAGGINIIVDVIVSDLVPLRQRGNYIAVVLLVYTIGTTLGPWVGGVIVANASWRWVFYINLPIGGLSLGMVLAFLRVSHNKEMPFRHKLKRIDYVGNAIIIGATVSILYALTYGGGKLPWSSAEVIAPLVIGLLGLCLFMWYETTTWVKDPVVPARLFETRTASAVFAATFLNSALLYWVLFFLPVYFQAVLGSTAERAGVQLLPAILVGIPGAIGAVLLLSKWGRYKPLHLIGFAIQTIGMGLFTLLDETSTTAHWVIYQCVAAFGSGFVLNTLLPAVQAQLDESDQAATTAAWSFMRSFGSIWGVAIPAAIFANRFSAVAETAITDAAVRAEFSKGNYAYERATAAYIRSFPPETQKELIHTYSQALKLVWQISIVFSGLSFLIVFFEREIKLRKGLETEFGLAKENEKKPIGFSTDVENGQDVAVTRSEEGK
ncbi:MFS general substrate transporter [Cladorrhinum sp. PSN259]|nr:MFS general substrate transporter [Cladorrhinum sp. PSN259]